MAPLPTAWASGTTRSHGDLPEEGCGEAGLVIEVRLSEVHLHRRAAVKELEKQRLAPSEMGVQVQPEVTVSAYLRPY